jgi:hypothetical protein
MPAASIIDFRKHGMDLGSDEAGRVSFHRMLSALIGIEYPTATDVRPAPGDWGIDVFVGSLIESVMIWQSKYFYVEIGKSQKQQIIDSFNSAVKNAAAQGYEIEAWTLCVACELSAPERMWWDKKVREWSSAHPTMSIELWDAPVLRRKLMSPDAAHVLEEFYGLRVDPIARAAFPISTEDPPDYSAALFVKQLTVAGIADSDGQRRAYFNADLLVRDVEARSVPAELSAIAELDGMLQSGWEDSMADPATTATDTDYEESARRLFSSVMAI